MEHAISPADALQSAIDKVKGATALMRAMNERGRDIKNTQTIYQWKILRVPADHCPTIEAITGVRCELLRPDVDWSVLRQKTEAAS